MGITLMIAEVGYTSLNRINSVCRATNSLRPNEPQSSELVIGVSWFCTSTKVVANHMNTTVL